jgi:hypothetical protein
MIGPTETYDVEEKAIGLKLHDDVDEAIERGNGV